MSRLTHWLSGRLEHRIAAGVLAISVGTLLLLGTASYYFSRTLLERNFAALLERRVQLAATRVEATVIHLGKEHLTLAGNSLTANALVDSQGRNTYLLPYMRGQWIAAELGFDIALCDFRGRHLASAKGGEAGSCGEVPATAGVVAHGVTYAAVHRANGKSGRLVLAAPVVYPATGAVEGMLVAAGPIEAIVQQSGLEVPSDAAFELLAADGQVLAQRGSANRRDTRLTSVRSLGPQPPLNTLGLTVRMAADASKVVEPLHWLTAFYVAVGLAVILIVLVLARLLARRLASPLVSFASVAHAIAANLQAQRAIPVEGHDEVAQLAHAFNEMVDKLRTSHESLEQRVAERTSELHEAEQRLAGVLNSVDDVIWSMSADGRRMNYVNPAVRRVAGISAEKFISSGGWPSVLADHDEAANFERAVGQARASDYVSSEFRIRRSDGAIAWLRCRMRAIRDASGALERIDGTATDVTETRRALALVHENVYRLNTIFELSPDGFVSFDANGRLASVNPAFLHLTGLSESELLGLELSAFEDKLRALTDDSSEPYPAISPPGPPAAPGGEAGTPRPALNDALCELRRPAKRSLLRRVRLGDAGWPELVLYFRDITHEAEVDRMKSEFLSSAAHEFRTPLASILGFSELLLTRNYDGPKREEVLGIVNRQAKLLANLVNELLDLARIEARAGKDFVWQLCNLDAIIDETAAATLVTTDKHALALAFARPQPQVRADREKLQQALSNVLSNAVKYSPGGGTIELGVLRRNEGGRDQVGIAVRDHGIGMTPEQAARAFERFYRADASGSIPGTGLGLALVKEIIEIHGGAVELKSVEGQGTEVVLWLPVAAAA